jgi:hypothetical protein
LTRGDAERLR